MPTIVILTVMTLMLTVFLAALAMDFIRLEKKGAKSGGLDKSGETDLEDQSDEDYYAEISCDDSEGDESLPDSSEEAYNEQTDEQFDKLCNLKVGRGYLAECQELLLTACESGQTFAAVYFDFNRFRFINTLRGYSTGDYALTRISQDAKQIFPEQALLTRLAADHFVAVFAYIDEAQIQDIYDHLRRSAERIRGDIGAKSGLQICMGVALTEQRDSYDIFKLMRKANIARYCLKHSRPDAYSVFNDTMITGYLYGESALDDYKELQYSDDFALYMQPQLLLSTKRVTCCDSRAGWGNEGSVKILIPDEAIVSSSNLKTVYHICRAMSRWRKSGAAALPTMVTIGELDLFKEDIDAFFARCLGEFQLDPSLLTVTVSIHTLRLAPEIVRTQLNRLLDVGVKLALRDIDRGNEWHDFLTTPPLANYFRVDKSISYRLESTPQRQELASQIISLAAVAGASTLFEGVDTAACIAWLIQAGASMAQGKYVGGERPPDEFAGDMKNLLNAGTGNTTVVLDDADLQRGNLRLY